MMKMFSGPSRGREAFPNTHGIAARNTRLISALPSHSILISARLEPITAVQSTKSGSSNRLFQGCHFKYILKSKNAAINTTQYTTRSRRRGVTNVPIGRVVLVRNTCTGFTAELTIKDGLGN